VPNSPWQPRIRRAELLAADHSFAAEILGFYIQVARFQEGLYQRIERGGNREGGGRDAAAPDPKLLVSFPSFLSLVEEKAPAPLAQVARSLSSSSSNSWSELLQHSWTNLDSPASPEEFVALAFLQPYAEYVRSRAQMQLEGYTLALCPFCNRKPGLGVLRQQGDGGRRSLLCGLCLTEWEFRRIICPGCGEENHAKLPVYTAESFPHIRVECCDSCRIYIKSVDLTKNGLADPLVDELTSVPLDLWAQERGYAKLRPNLLGM
jgi:FdhE protein